MPDTTIPTSPVSRVLREFVMLTALAFVPYVGAPAILHAQEAPLRPFQIEGSHSLTRGSITPVHEPSYAFAREDACTIAIQDWGWGTCEHIDAYLLNTTPETDSVLIETPDSNGYVTFDDWNAEDLGVMIGQIEEAERQAAAEQGRRLGLPVEFVGWRLEPTLDRERQIMYYSTDWAFDGEISTSVRVQKFDRRGYVSFDIIPIGDDPDPATLRGAVEANLALYAPAPQQDYASFTSGDKVAAVGALGLLGTMFGVKYGKGAGGILAAALLILKKFGVYIVGGIAVLGGSVLRRLRGRD